MKKITMGIVAHVDAGKTTLSESLLYKAGNIRTLGRVDNGDAFLDTDALEKARGITIFSHEAKLMTDNSDITLLDTPGHVDFAFQTEEILSVLDYAILVISASDGVTNYTKTLWNLLKRHNVPVFIFVNKMDTVGANKVQVLDDIQTNLSQNSVDFSKIDDDFYENIAASDDELLEKYLNDNRIEDTDIQDLIEKRKVFPIYFGSALKLTGISEFLTSLDQWTKETDLGKDFAARCFKITHDKNGERLTWLRVLGGELKAKSELNHEKVNQLRVYNGEKFTTVASIGASEIVAATGLTKTYPGEGFNTSDALNATLKPVLTYRVNFEPDDLHVCLNALKTLEDENPQLHVTWSEHLQEMHVQVMGKIQLEILEQLLKKQFNLEVGFDQGSILYKETITDSIEAVGHFEPLRHYAEVHLLLEPGEKNIGDRAIIIGSAPVSEMQDYAAEVRSYTHGDGNLECVVKGYLPCHNTQEIIEKMAYDPVSDLENTPNSVFCSHGAGHTVTWDKVPEKVQYPYSYR